MTVPRPPASAGIAAPSAALAAWPRAAQLTTAFLLGALISLLAAHAWGSFRWSSRPTDLVQGSRFAYQVDLNVADKSELLQLPGVGNNLANRIAFYRGEHGGFRQVDDLTQIP